MEGKEILDQDGMNIDKDMDGILTILRDIPQVSVPEEFDQRLHKALKKEGEAIRRKKGGPFTGGGKWHIKLVATVAACFLVVFASVSVYNGYSGGLLKNQSLADCAMENGSEMESASPGFGGLGSPDTEMDEGPLDSQENNIRLYKACDDLNKEYLADEEEVYIKLIEERLSGYEYQLLECDQGEVIGEYHFIVEITYDPRGENTGKQLTFLGKLGELYEGQGKKSKINSD